MTTMQSGSALSDAVNIEVQTSQICVKRSTCLQSFVAMSRQQKLVAVFVWLQAVPHAQSPLAVCLLRILNDLQTPLSPQPFCAHTA